LSDQDSAFAVDAKNPAGWLLHIRAQTAEDFITQLNQLFDPEVGNRSDLTNVIVQSFNPAVIASMTAGQDASEALGYEPDELATSAYQALAQGATRAPRQAASSGGGGGGGRDRDSGFPEWFTDMLDNGECPSCESTDFWDNRAKIKSGDYSKKSPHFKCKDCDKGFWPTPPPKSGQSRGGRGD
jgi:hypothetical protein